jgi:protein-S-isoprenylcysteine O-methyltransferase
VIAISTSFIEYFIEFYFFQKYKFNLLLFLVGFMMLVVGQFFRIAALFTAQKNFTHLISYKKKVDHILVKTGVYSISRHPSYFGYFIWCVGCQILCMNFICIVGFTLVLWNFFNQRIKEEELMLISFFGDEYLEYKKCTPILIPCIIFLIFSH